MHHLELLALLDGAEGGTIIFETPDGPVEVYLDRDALASPLAWRRAIRRQVGWSPPVYRQADHDQIVRAMFALADLEEVEAASKAA